MTRLATELARLEKEIQLTNDLLGRVKRSPDMPNHYIAELLIVRLFAVFESVIQNSACHLVCGDRYCDGLAPTLLRPKPTKGRVRALAAMRTYNRGVNPRNTLRWTKPSEIKDNLEHLFPHNEHFTQTLSNYSQLISEVRKVRNHVAHRNDGTRQKFQEVVRAYYGANVSAMTPGKLLVTPRFTPCMVERWSSQLRLIIKTAVRA